MQTITNEALDFLRAGKQVDVKIVVDGLEQSTIIKGDSILKGSIKLDRNSVSGNTIEIGNAETSEFSFELDNTKHQWDSFKFEGAVLTVDFIIGTDILRAGYFIVDSIPKTASSVKIVSLDYMAKFNKYFTDTITEDVTLGEMLTYCCNYCGVTQNTMSFTNDIYVTKFPEAGSVTYHELISYIAELAGANAWIDWNGELRLSWYGENQDDNVIEITASDRFSYDMAENDIRITGVSYSTTDLEYLVGTDIYALTIENNPLVVEATVSDLLNNIFTKVELFTYRPFEFTTKFYPHIWQLDIIKITDSAGYIFNSIVTNTNLIVNSNQTMIGKGESTQTISYASSAPFTAKQQKILERVVDLRAGTQITALDQAMIQLNALAVNAQGFYETSVTQEDGSRIDYMHDQPLLADSNVVYKTSIDGFFWTNNYDGESTIWTSGYTASGNIVAKQLDVIGINADWISTGLITGAKLADGTISDVKVATGLSATKITTGALSSSNFSGTGDGSAFSTTGTKINMNDGTISAPKFRIASDGSAVFAGSVTGGTININNNFTVDSSGNLTKANNAYLTGTISTNGQIETNGGIDINNGGLYVEGETTFDDTIWFKAWCKPNSNNVHQLGSNDGTNGLKAWKAVWSYAFSNPSDRALKTDIKPIDKGVELILNIDPVQFKFIDDQDGQIHYGLIAQDFKAELDNLGIDNFAGYIDGEYKALTYTELISPMVQTIQHLEQRIKELESKLEQLSN